MILLVWFFLPSTIFSTLDLEWLGLSQVPVCCCTGKVNGLDFPMAIRSSKFTQYKEIEGMDPLQVPLWKFLYQGSHNNWLRRIAHGRKTYVIPFDNSGTTVFVAELVSQLPPRNIDFDRLAAYRSRNQGTNLQQKEATQQMVNCPADSTLASRQNGN